MSAPLLLHGRTAVVTGVASGIGRAISVSLAKRGCHLALADLDESGLAETERLLGASGVRVSRHRLDVADRDLVMAFPARVLAEHPGVDLLVNNAGVAVGGDFEQVSEADFDWLLNINLFGVVRMTRAFLPLLRASDDARLVNLSSIFGIIAPAGQSAYVASKFAVRGFSESLRHELEGTTVGVTVVHPGGVSTNIARSARLPAGVPAEVVAKRRKEIERSLSLPPEIAGETIVRAVERRAPRVLVGADAKVAAFLERLAPVSYWKIIRRRLRR